MYKIPALTIAPTPFMLLPIELRDLYYSTRNGIRTHTDITVQRILSPSWLPFHHPSVYAGLFHRHVLCKDNIKNLYMQIFLLIFLFLIPQLEYQTFLQFDSW